ncbi:MAG: 30S ribosomal protein S15 [archaeon]
MARMHSRKKGKSGSTKPFNVQPSWMSYKPKEVELLIAKLAKEGKTASQIGLHLRDTYGICSVAKVTKKDITVILKEKKLLPDIPDDLMALIRKSLVISRHREENKQDQTAKRGQQLTESKIRRLMKYYKGTKRLPLDWKYDPKKASLFVE